MDQLCISTSTSESTATATSTSLSLPSSPHPQTALRFSFLLVLEVLQIADFNWLSLHFPTARQHDGD